MYWENNPKGTGMAIFISDEMDFKTIIAVKDKKTSCNKKVVKSRRYNPTSENIQNRS